MIDNVVKIFQAFNANTKRSEIANAFCIGVMLGLVPKNNVLWYVLFIVFFFVRIHKGMYVISMLLASLVAPLGDALFDKIGYAILTFPKLENFFSFLLDVPFVGFTKFNNSIVMGSFAFSLVAYIPFFILMMILVKLWRQKIAGNLKNTALAKALNSLPFVSKLAEKISDLKR